MNSRLARHACGVAEADGSPNKYKKQKNYRTNIDFSQFIKQKF